MANLTLKLRGLEEQIRLLKAEFNNAVSGRSRRKVAVTKHATAKGALKGITPRLGECDFKKIKATWNSPGR